MANFGFSRLAVVAPSWPNWREARSAIGADELLQKANRTESLAEAVTDCTLVAATGTLTRRKPEQRVGSLPDTAPLIRQEINRAGVSTRMPQEGGRNRWRSRCRLGGRRQNRE